MCVEALSRLFPCLGHSSPSTASDGAGSSPSWWRLALSITSIALGVFAGAAFLATNSLIALGATVGLGVAAICLWPRIGSRPTPPPIPLGPGFVPFGAQLPPPMPMPMPMPFVPPPPMRPVHPETRIHPGDRGTPGFAPMYPPQMPFPVAAQHHQDQRIHPGDRQSPGVHLGGHGGIPGGHHHAPDDRVSPGDRQRPGAPLPDPLSGESRIPIRPSHH